MDIPLASEHDVPTTFAPDTPPGMPPPKRPSAASDVATTVDPNATALEEIRVDRDNLLQTDAIDKSAALRVLQQHHALEELLMRTTHAKEIQRMQQDAANVREAQRMKDTLSMMATDVVQLQRRQAELEEQVRQLTAAIARRK